VKNISATKLPGTSAAGAGPRPCFFLRAGKFSLALGQRTQIMGILNITPDSFSGDGLLRKSQGHKVTLPTAGSQIKTKEKAGIEKALILAEKMIADGADIIDIGGESTRPGAKRLSAPEEIKRIIPAITSLAKTANVPISADTYKSVVAQHALDAGATIINNIKGVRSEKSLLKMVARYNAAIVLMHIRGTPSTMQKNIRYQNDVLREILDALKISVENCLEIGIKSDRIIIDPGICFGKTAAQNLEILHRLPELQRLGVPVMIGTSRKSFIGTVLNRDVPDRLWGTIASITAGIMNGAHIVRVHDVSAAKDAAKITDAILNIAAS